MVLANGLQSGAGLREAKIAGVDMSHLKRVAVAFAVLGLSACAGDPNMGPNQTAGTAVGAVAGGIIGSTLGRGTGGKIAGAIAGATVGGILGNAVGASFDDRSIEMRPESLAEYAYPDGPGRGSHAPETMSRTSPTRRSSPSSTPCRSSGPSRRTATRPRSTPPGWPRAMP